jgi:phosphoglycolate phosphatase-like HAD superfamily hydrolase
VILLWDIDGTLLTTGRAGIFAWEDAAAEVLGESVDFSKLATGGLTDVEIAALILSAHGAEATPETVERLVRLYESYLPRSLPRRQGRVLPNVQEILEHLTARTDIRSLLLTGNTRAGAAAKLAHYGLAKFFNGGAFSDGLPDRPSIARRALAMVRAERRSGMSEAMYVIGDTPHDIACAEAIGARTVAVATGTYSLGELEARSPWWALEALPDPENFLARLEAA